ncbi:MAG: histidine kinase [Lachnospiraceae bacterium]|nr:histidine kinase [Lachnospiraceae bacterium]
MNIDYLFASLELWGGIFCIIGAVYSFVARKTYSDAYREMIAMLLCSAVMMVSDLLAFFFRGQMSTIGLFLVPVGNLMMFFLPFLDLMFFGSFLWKYSTKDFTNRALINVLFGICVCAMVLTTVSIFNNMYFYVDAWNYYHRGPYFWVSQVIGIGGFVVVFAIIIYNRKHLGLVRFLAFTSYIFFPFVMHLSQQIVYTLISRVNVGIEISALVILMVMIMEQNKTMAIQENQISEQRAALLEQERAISEMQIRLVISQIQPHFLYNALNAIYYLCEKDSAKAQSAINYFSEYLRGNMDALSGDSMIPVSKELQHIRSYLALEKMRFDDELRIEYDIGAKDFKVPALSLQPIVENGVKHGLGKKLHGGTLKIYTYDRGDNYEIIVSDDGVGFDPEHAKEGSRSHIGVENVRKRLETLCHGTLEIESTMGVGTCAIIRIPKNEMTKL